ncbi:MAG: ABC transporter permease [Chloroflexi bacterium]|nr:ABC transporter permease [Chloroflexota bacterium]
MGVPAVPVALPAARRIPATKRGLLRRNRAMAAAALVYLLFVFVALAAPLLAPSDPDAQVLPERFKPPGWLTGEPDHPLGADNLGRDVLSRLIFGARVSIAVGVATVVASAVLGSALGAIAGYARGHVDGALLLLLDIWMAFPPLVLAIALSAALGPGLPNLILALVLTGWVSYCRVIRGEVLSLREREFVLAARVIGASGARIVARHLMPNVMAPILVLATLEMATVIISEAALSFLGLGVGASQPTWGGMLNDGRQFLRQAWWLATFPGLAISVLVLSVNLLGDSLRDALDPRLRSR